MNSFKRDEKFEKNFKQIEKKFIKYSRCFHLWSVFKLLYPVPDPGEPIIYGWIRIRNNAEHCPSHSLSYSSSQALGMKLVVRTNNMGRMKAIFTTEIFTESTVAAHAVKERLQHRFFILSFYF